MEHFIQDHLRQPMSKAHQDGLARGRNSMNRKRTWLRQLVDLDPLTMLREKFQQRSRVQ